MSRKIFCTFLQCNTDGQDFQIYPGELGERIFNEISKVAWSQWMTRQTMLINDKKLNTLNSKHLKMLEEEMIKFLFKKRGVNINAYIPKNN
ncbi:putative Fe(2+)-trafficking protein [Candidatus Hartigia pinicola]|nr:putative Fe(2+)-trafficking protein [Candidatus Hartigia pinicola]